MASIEADNTSLRLACSAPRLGLHITECVRDRTSEPVVMKGPKKLTIMEAGDVVVAINEASLIPKDLPDKEGMTAAEAALQLHKETSTPFQNAICSIGAVTNRPITIQFLKPARLVRDGARRPSRVPSSRTYFAVGSMYTYAG